MSLGGTGCFGWGGADGYLKVPRINGQALSCLAVYADRASAIRQVQVSGSVIQGIWPFILRTMADILNLVSRKVKCGILQNAILSKALAIFATSLDNLHHAGESFCRPNYEISFHWYVPKVSIESFTSFFLIETINLARLQGRWPHS